MARAVARRLHPCAIGKSLPPRVTSLFRLAGLARAIRNRIQTALAIETEGGRIKTLMKGFREALVHDLDTDAFADMYAQTIAYGLLSTRIADPNRKTADDFASHMHTNPFLRDLMETFLQVGGRHTKPGAGGSTSTIGRF